MSPYRRFSHETIFVENNWVAQVSCTAFSLIMRLKRTSQNIDLYIFNNVQLLKRKVTYKNLALLFSLWIDFISLSSGLIIATSCSLIWLLDLYVINGDWISYFVFSFHLCVLHDFLCNGVRQCKHINICYLQKVTLDDFYCCVESPCRNHKVQNYH